MRNARFLAALAGAAALAAPAAAFAQPAPAQPAAPSYARPAAGGEETVKGRIMSFDGKYRLNVRDERGFIDSVEMHQGTVINPTGLELQPGMTVTILGYNRGPVLAANEIDTPYVSYRALPLVYPAYPAYSFGLGFGFGPVYFHHWH